MNAGASNPQDPMPVVQRSGGGNIGLWVFLAILLAGGIGVFTAMSASREASQAPRVTAAGSENARIVAPPPLVIRDDYADLDETRYIRAIPRDPLSPARPVAPPVQPPAPRTVAPPPAPLPPRPADPAPYREAFVPRQVPPSPTSPPALSDAPADAASEAADRISAGRLRNPSFTVPQGTVLPAVLETALDSTRPGAVRALIQRDIHAFDGSRVLIHRGSRLYGEYEGGIEQGQNRALIRWTRLIRPDGVTIALDSPASDPLGRAGVKGKVDGKFLQRFGGAILQSVLDIGVGVATREATGGVVVALPRSSQTIAGRSGPQDIKPVLKVRHGTSVSVFVARDLDFSSVDS
ncbi:type IV secretion system protein VirB10 [Qipengyuania pelagi]|nr:TrbI/VirB10 family protein [Qipengyuania pelagi]